ncbi:MAG: adenylyltransferase/cytidyltransferase family protein, partial [Clostridiales bacterium]|nr:adenylyltransferase/cytidyltransferase family protein [Clostridiales bacterium]
MFNAGLYCGTFSPPHLGHVKCMTEAMNQCRELHIVISHSRNPEEIDIRQRYRWIYQLTKHFDNVRLHILEDSTDSKPEYTSEYWQADAEKVKAMVGKR